jgi:hypothetical protein
MKHCLPSASLLVALLAAAPLGAQSMIKGRVLDAASGEPVASASVRAFESTGRLIGRTHSEADGTFSIAMRVPGGVVLTAERTGYTLTRTAEMPVALRETVEVELRLSSAAVAVEPLRVTARVQPPFRRNLELNGFYQREQMGQGNFVRREEFANLANQNLAQVLQRARGTRIMYAGTKQFIYFPRNGEPTGGAAADATALPLAGRRGAPRNGCLPRLYLDGALVTYDVNNDINSLISPDQIEAIELFRGASEIPVQYGGANAMCGVILIWTRTEQ